MAAVGIGSNLGDRHAHVEGAIRSIARLPWTRLVARGSVIRTRPVARPGVDPGGEYLNSAVVISTRLSAHRLLNHLLTIERGHGRVRAGVPAWSARTLDLDLLVYGQYRLNQPGLHVPHPRLPERRFALEPLAAARPDLLVPVSPGRCVSVIDLLRELPEDDSVQQSSDS